VKKRTLFDELRQRCADEPNPPPVLTQGSGVSAQVRRNRVRIGLPEYLTKEELERWSKR
jgi:hypothetical protein